MSEEHGGPGSLHSATEELLRYIREQEKRPERLSNPTFNTAEGSTPRYSETEWEKRQREEQERINRDHKPMAIPVEPGKPARAPEFDLLRYVTDHDYQRTIQAQQQREDQGPKREDRSRGRAPPSLGR